MVPPRRGALSLTLIALLAVPLAGCVGGGIGLTGDGGPLNADFSVEPAGDGRTFIFDASASSGADIAFSWDLGDGTTATGEVVEHTYEAGDGILGVILTVTDADGATDMEVRGVTVGTGANEAPGVSIELSDDWVTPGTPVQARAVVDDPEGDDVSIQWAYGNPAPPPPPHGEDPTDYDPVDNNFDSPEIDTGDDYRLTFSEDDRGVYTYHCHPHPWMTGAIVVADAPGAMEGTVELTAHNLKDWLPQKVVVKPGTELVFENPDPTWHSVTLSLIHPMTDFLEADADAQNGETTTLALDDTGDYSVFAIVTDSKGEVTVENALFRVSREVPPSTVNETWTGTVPAPTDEDPATPDNDPPAHGHTFDFPGNATVGLDWTAASPDQLTGVTLEVYQGERAAGDPVAVVEGRQTVDLAVAADDYLFRVVVDQGLNVNYTVTMEAVLDVEPDFGGAGECPEPHKSLGHC